MDLPEKQDTPSKTQRKQAMNELQEVGEALAALSADRLKKIDIPEVLRDAIAAVQRMTRSDEAKRRQMQYIGKLMRSVDIEPIRQVLAVARGESDAETGKMHRLERLRADLLADENVLHELVLRYPAIDLQHLRALRRSALKEQASNKPPRSYRAIFQLLKTLEVSAEGVAEQAAQEGQHGAVD
ncbi:MAG: ribosome biogenesis factor YjgA [Pseudomonadota bacterium]